MEEIDLKDDGCEIKESVGENSEDLNDSSLSLYTNDICDESSILLFEKITESDSNILNGGDNGKADHNTQKLCIETDESNTIANNLDDSFDKEKLNEMSKDELLKFINSSLQRKYSMLTKANAKYEEEIQKYKSEASQYTLLVEELQNEITQSKADAFAWENELLRTKERLNQEKVSLQAELTSRLETAVKRCEAANHAKEEMVMKYAKAEKDVIVVRKHKENLEKRNKELEKDKELLKEKIKNLSSEKSRVSATLDQKIQECGVALRNIDKLKDEIVAKDVKIKWGQTKLKNEMDVNKELQRKLDIALSKVCDHDEETGTTGQEDEKVVKGALNEENAKGNALEKQLQETKASLILQTQKLDDLTPIYRQLKADHGNLTATHLLLQTEVTSLKAKVCTHQQEREESEKLFESLQSELRTTKCENNHLSHKLSEFESLQKELESERENKEELHLKCQQLQETMDEHSVELSIARQKESELLVFTRKLTEEDVVIRSQLLEAQEKAHHLESDHKVKVTHTKELQDKLSNCVKEIKSLENSKKIEEEKLNSVINGLNEEISGLRTKISDLENDLVVQQRRQGNSIKDSNREIQKLRRKLEGCDCSSRKTVPSTVPRSSCYQEYDEQTSESRSKMTVLVDSNESHFLDRVTNWTPSQPLSQGSRTSSEASLNTDSSHVNGPFSYMTDGESGNSSELTQRALVNRIAKLQSDLLKKREKTEFLEEHVTQLVQELKNKNRIINYYLLKEDTGSIAGSKSDDAKAEILKHGGIMASVYSSSSKDTSMTLELSLEINKKLQAVLEDTLLKNITLKENLNTLGDEVAKLALQNSQSRKQ